MNEISSTRTANVFKSIRRVFVHNLVLSARIGIHAHERTAPQRIRINLNLGVCENNGPVDDRLETVVCYEMILQRVRNIVASGHVNLVETLAEHIATVCLQDTRVQHVRVKVEKIEISHDVGSVGVEIERCNPWVFQAPSEFL